MDTNESHTENKAPLKFNPILYFIFSLIIITLVVCCYIQLSYIKTLQKELKSTNAKILELNSERTQPEASINFKNKTKAIYYDGDGNVKVSDLDGNNVATIHSKTGTLDVLAQPAISPDGQYLAYLRQPNTETNMLNPSQIQESDKYQLWIENLTTHEKNLIKDSFVNNIDSHPLVWDRVSSRIYFSQLDNNKPSGPNKNYYIDIKTKIQKEVLSIPISSLSVSPDNKFFIGEEKKSLPNDPVNVDLTLNLYTLDGTFVKTLYNASRYYKYDINYATESYFLLTSTSYESIGDPNSIKCYLTLVDINSGKAADLESKNCSVPENATGLMKPKLSPDGKYILALYSDKERNEGATFTGSMLIYDTEDKSSKYIAQTNTHYTDYDFVSQSKILIYTTNFIDNITRFNSYSLDWPSENLTKVKGLGNKNIIGAY